MRYIAEATVIVGIVSIVIAISTQNWMAATGWFVAIIWAALSVRYHEK